MFPIDTVIEHQGFTIIVDAAKLNIINLHIPPASNCPSGYRPNLDLLLSVHNEDPLVVGDFNTNNISWFSRTVDPSNGTTITNLYNRGELALLNEDKPSRISRTGHSSSPDFAIVSLWIPISPLNSDHQPVIIKLVRWFLDHPRIDSHNYTKHKKAR